MSENTYTVEKQDGGCASCGANQMFDVVYRNGQPEELAMSTSFGDEEAAQDLCDELNSAHERANAELKALQERLARAEAGCAEMRSMLSLLAHKHKNGYWYASIDGKRLDQVAHILEGTNPGASLLAELESLKAERDTLKGQLEPSPCDVAGHRKADWVEDGKGFLAYHCLACDRERTLRDVLKSVEWSNAGGVRHCPSCRGYSAGDDPLRHYPDCRLVAALKGASNAG